MSVHSLDHSSNLRTTTFISQKGHLLVIFECGEKQIPFPLTSLTIAHAVIGTIGAPGFKEIGFIDSTPAGAAGCKLNDRARIDIVMFLTNSI